MPLRLNDLGELQLAVLNVLWNCPDASVHEVLSALPEERSPKYTTVLTVLRTLEKRGLITHDAAAGTRKFRYRALMTVQQARGDIVEDLVQKLFEGSAGLLVSYLLDTAEFEGAELRALRHAVNVRELGLIGNPAS